MLKRVLKGNGRLANEKGAISIEFLGILPFYFLFFLILWQAVSTGYAIMSTKTAVNEAAKYYAVTGDEIATKEKIKNAIGSQTFMIYHDTDVVHSGPTFQIEVKADHSIVFIPDRWKDRATIPIVEKATGRLFQ